MKRPKVPEVFRVLLQVGDLGAARRFYETLLETKASMVGGGRVYFRSGPIIFALLDVSSEGGSTSLPLPEPVYLAAPDLEGVFRRAGRLGCLSKELIHHDPANPAGAIVVRPWGERSFYVVDPWGNPLCFVDPATRFTGAARRNHIRSSRSTRRRPRAHPGTTRH